MLAAGDRVPPYVGISLGRAPPKVKVGRKLVPFPKDSEQQCTACAERFGCPTYTGSLKGGAANPDVDRLNVFKN
jgi:hypothetical protein